MSDLKKAYEVLGLAEGSSREDVESRYELLLLKFRRDTGGEPGQPTQNEINVAYRTIIDSYMEQQISQAPKRHPVIERWSHFWEYYRVHTIVSILAIVAIVYTAGEIVKNREEARLAEKAAVKAMFLGEFRFPNADPMRDWLLQQFPQWEHAIVMVQQSPIEPRDPYEIAMLQKAMVSLAAERPDLYILDPLNYEKYVKQGGFMPLDEYVQKWNLDAGVQSAYRTVAQEGTAPRQYGLEVTASPAFTGLQTQGQKLVIAVGMQSKNMENALLAVEKIVAAAKK